MSRKLFCMLLALCLLLNMAVLAAAEDKLPACGNPEHRMDDGLDHRRPDPCWVYGHFNCDGRDHNRASCRIGGHYGCDGRDHGQASCGAQGHYACVPVRHETPACGIYGHCINDGKHHIKAGCGVEGHYVCDGQRHRTAVCGKKGHLGCDGTDHSAAVCGKPGHYACDGLEHAPAVCGRRGHCAADGRNHGAGECGYAGHIGCNGEHGIAVCGVNGHYACEKGHTAKVNPYCTAEPKHTLCQKEEQHVCDPEKGGCGKAYPCEDSNKHTVCRMCGLLWCDGSLGGHYTPCGNPNHRPCVYTLKGKVWREADHPRCHLCGEGKCTGAHGEGICVPLCDQCGKAITSGRTHRASCGIHFSCISKGLDHSWCSKCGLLKCASGGAHVCP